MISEQEAREAKSRLDDFYNGIAKDILARYALQELARRDWQDEPIEDGWYWCEELDADAPPQKIAQHSLGIDANGDDIHPTWKRWTIDGWVSLTGRVCKITERPT